MSHAEFRSIAASDYADEKQGSRRMSKKDFLEHLYSKDYSKEPSTALFRVKK